MSSKVAANVNFLSLDLTWQRNRT